MGPLAAGIFTQEIEFGVEVQPNVQRPASLSGSSESDPPDPPIRTSTKFRNTGTREQFTRKINVKPPRGTTFPEWWTSDSSKASGNAGQDERVIRPSKEWEMTAINANDGWVHERNWNALQKGCCGYDCIQPVEEDGFVPPLFVLKVADPENRRDRRKGPQLQLSVPHEKWAPKTSMKIGAPHYPAGCN